MEAYPKNEVEVARLVFLRSGRDPAVLDVHRSLRDAGHRAGVDTGFLRQFALRRAGERYIGRLRWRPGCNMIPYGRCLTSRDLVPRTSSAPAVTCTGKFRREAKSPP